MAKVYGSKARDGGATCVACEAKIEAGQLLIKVSEAAGVVKLYCMDCANKAKKAVEIAAEGLMVSALESLEPRPVELVEIAPCLDEAFLSAWEA